MIWLNAQKSSTILMEFEQKLYKTVKKTSPQRRGSNVGTNSLAAVSSRMLMNKQYLQQIYREGTDRSTMKIHSFSLL